ncbi:MAG: S8 family serine peptidase [Phycisphaerales bacterium]
MQQRGSLWTPVTVLALCCAASSAAGQAGPPAAAGAAAGARAIRLAAGTLDTTRARADVGGEIVAAGRRVIVQFDGPLTQAKKQELDEAGVTLLGYLGDGAHAARVTPRGGAGVIAARVPHARWVGEYEALLRVSPALNRAAFTSPERREMARRGEAAVVVTLFKDASPEEIAEVVTRIQGVAPGGGGAVIGSRDSVAGNVTITATMPEAAAKALASLPSVQFVEDAPDVVERDSTQRWVVQSNVPNFTPLYAAGLSGAGQVIGIADSRPDFNHCAFSDVNPIGPSHRKILAYNTTNFTFRDHGTHVAGIVAGDAGAFDDNRGVAYAAKFVYSPTPAFNQESVTGVFNLHHSQGARVHTNSWGNDATTQYDSLARGIDAFMHANEDDLVVFAVTNQATLKNPENCKNALAVGATQDAPSQDSFCSGGVGPTVDGRRKPEVFAPGCGIASAQAFSACSVVQLTGTSMATPAVSGIASLIREYFVSGRYPGGTANPANAMTPSGALLKAMILNATQDMASYSSSIPNSSEGWGRLAADLSVELPGDARKLFVRDARNAGGLTTGGVVEIPLTVNASGESLRVTLAWTEPPAAAGSADPVINNLDLEVVAPDASLFRGNVFAGGFSMGGGSADTKNNVEQVHVNAPAVGVWTLRIKGSAVNQGLQGFALVANGALTAPPTPISIAINAPPPSIVPSNVHAQFGVTINTGGDALVPGSARLAWRRSPADTYSFSPLFALGGDQYRATLPRFACSDTPDFYVEVGGVASGTVTAPLGGASAAPVALQVGTLGETVLFSEDFEAGLPAGWSATGLWHVTGACVQGTPCDGVNWAYFGADATCTYGPPLSGRQQGLLTLPTLALPTIGVGESLAVRYCWFMKREQAATFDLAKVLVNGVSVDQPSADSTAWATRSADVSVAAGTSPTIAFSFDTVDGFQNTFLGWQVDKVEVVKAALTCAGPAPCVADFNNDGAVNTSDLTFFVNRFGQIGEAFSTPADINGDGVVDTRDLLKLLGQFGVGCP